MDSLKVSLDRVFGFLTAIIPGSAVLVVLSFHHPDWLNWFRNTKDIGYHTKIWLLLSLAFILGWSLTILLLSLLEAIKFQLYGNRSMQSWDNLSSVPWRQTHWRAQVAAVYGKGAPENITFIYDDTVTLQIEMAERLQEPDRTRLIGEVRSNKLKANMNDNEWKSWWRDLHTARVTEARDPVLRMTYALADNIYTTSIFILFAAPFNPQLRRWWLIGLCLFWVVQLVARIYRNFAIYADPWASYLPQMEHLRRQLELADPDN